MKVVLASGEVTPYEMEYQRVLQVLLKYIGENPDAILFDEVMMSSGGITVSERLGEYLSQKFNCKLPDLSILSVAMSTVGVIQLAGSYDKYIETCERLEGCRVVEMNDLELEMYSSGYSVPTESKVIKIDLTSIPSMVKDMMRAIEEQGEADSSVWIKLSKLLNLFEVTTNVDGQELQKKVSETAALFTPVLNVLEELDPVFRKCSNEMIKLLVAGIIAGFGLNHTWREENGRV